MKRLLIISKKKVLRAYVEGILIPYDGTDGDALKKWVSARYNLSVVKTQMVAESDIVALTVVENQHCGQGEYISIAKAIELIDKENGPLRNYLNSLRVEFDIQLEYQMRAIQQSVAEGFFLIGCTQAAAKGKDGIVIAQGQGF